ncbi:MAG TPA: 2Fe-2S iron-sulfur cluster binding domain-containing protein [Porticoccus sp.]|nr:2Fe-2S iron-sulfur cluster binding domain-containing protein [Porticoccus sp.]
MGHKFAEIAFTDAVKNIQLDKRSRDNYAKMEQGEDFNYLISPTEAEFISERDSFYMASVSETDWPYVQHRGGPAGFMKVIDAETIGFADFSGNRQYISTGNFSHNDRVALFFMDYPNRRRLKLLGRVQVVGQEAPELLHQLKSDNYRAKIERGFIIHVEAFDWNCPQHITPRYTEEEVEAIIEQRLALLPSPSLPGQPQQTQNTTSFGDGPLALTITGIRQLTPQVRAYELRSATDQALPEVTAGSHLEVPITLSDGSQSHRHYSICSNPARRDIYEIAVLNKEDGTGGSFAIHQHYQLGTIIHCGSPANYFETHVDEKQPVILIAGGIGITPIKAIAQALLEKGHPVHLHYTGRSLKDMAFSDRLQRALGDHITLYPADKNQRLNVQQLMQQASKNTIFYACGPEKLLKEITTLGVSLFIPANNIRLERFSPTHEANDQAITVTLAGTAQVIEVAAQQSILDALLSAGIDANYSCKTGQCKQCVVEVAAGEVDHRDSVLSEAEQQTQFCPCVSRAKTDHLSIKL